jgi:hypothetical protein
MQQLAPGIRIASVGARGHSCPALSSPGRDLTLRVGFGCLVGGDCETEIGYWLGFAGAGLELGLEPGLEPGPGLGGGTESGWVTGGCISSRQRRWFVR